MELIEVIERIPGWIWRASWQASVLALLVLAAQWLCSRRLAPNWRYALWFLVVIRLLMPVTPPSPWSLFNYRVVEDFSAPDLEWWTRAETREMAPQDSTRVPAIARTQSSSEETISRPTAPLRLDQKPELAWRSIIPSTLMILRQNTGWIWFLGVVALSMRLAWGNYLFGLQLRRRRPIAEPAVLALFEECRRTMGIRRPLVLLEAPELDGPALFGCFQVKLLLPERMIETFTPPELRHVFLHELAHTRRWDAAMNWLTTILQTLHWFNPVLWFAFNRMRADREVACDELALARANEVESKPYGQTVIKVLEGFSGPTAIPGLVGILEDKTQIKRRIHMIAQFKKTAPWPAMAAVLLIALGLVSLTDAQIKKGAEKRSENVGISDGNGPKEDSDLQSTPSLGKTPAGLSLRKLTVPEQFLSGNDPSPSPDGRFLILGSLYPVPRYDPGACILDLSTGGTRVITNLFVRSPKFSADGDRVVFGRYDSNDVVGIEIARISPALEKPRPLFREGDYVKLTDWSRDEKRVLFMRGKHQSTKSKDLQRVWGVGIVSAETGSPQLLKQLERWNSDGTMKFSPDARWIVYDAPNGTNDNSPRDLHLLASDGSKDIPLVQHPADDYVMAWSPFGDRILFASNRRRTWDLFSVHVVDGKQIGEPELLKEGIGQTESLGITSSGALFYRLATSSIDVHLFDLDPASGRTRGTPIKAPYSFEGFTQSPDWSRDGRFLSAAVSRGDGESLSSSLIIRDMFDGTERELKLDGGPVTSPRWSPDGINFVASGRERGMPALFQIDARTGKTVLLPVRPSNQGIAGWESDGKAFYYQSSPRQQALIRRELETGAETEFPRVDMSWQAPPASLSPDGQHVAWRNSKNHQNLGSGVSVYGTNSQCNIYVVPRNGGKPHQLVEISYPEWIGEVLWTPDSRYVMFTRELRDWSPQKTLKIELCRVSVTGGEPEVLGELPKGASELRISPSGIQLAFTVRRSKREVWVMENFLPRDKVAAK